MTTDVNTDIVSLDEAPRSQSLYSKALRRLREDKLTIIMGVVLAILVIFSYSAPLLESTFNVTYKRVAPENQFLPMGSTAIRCNNSVVPVDAEGEVEERIAAGEDCTTQHHVLGTDDIGRDQLARLAKAGQITLRIAFLAALLSLTIGVSIGIVTGYYGGLVDDFIMWFITTLNSIPQLFLLLIVFSVLRPGPDELTFILGILGWTGTARLVRGETLALREREYVVSARSVGASDIRIMSNHIMPNLISVVIISLAIDIGALMLTEAALSFLGFGVQPPTPTWGSMLNNARLYMTSSGAHLVVFPGALITISVLCLYVIGDGIRDAFDPTVND